MINLNEQQKAIFKEEIGRACFIMHAQNRLDEHDFKIFMQELRDYEANLVITESNQGEFLYEGFFDRLKNMASGAFAKIAPDNTAKLQKLADELGMIDAQVEVAEELGNKSEVIALKAKARSLVQDMAKIDPTAAQEAGKLYNMPGSVEEPKAKPVQASAIDAENERRAKEFADAGDKKAQSARGDSFFSKLFGAMGDSIMSAQGANKSFFDMAQRGFDSFFQPKQPIPLNREDEVLMNAFTFLYNKDPNLAAAFARAKLRPQDMQAHMDNIPDGAPDDDEGGDEGDAGAEGAAGSSSLDKDTPISVMTRQKDVKPGKGGEKEVPLVMSIQKMGVSQKSAQQIAKRIGQYLKQRQIAIAESMNRLTVQDTDRIVQNIVFNAPKSLLLTLFEEVSKEDMEEIFAARRTKSPKAMKKVYRKMSMKYHPDRGGSSDDMAKINSEIGKSVYEKYEEKADDKKDDKKPVKSSGETPSAEKIEKDIKSNPEKAAIILRRDVKDAGVKIDDKTVTALQTQFDKVKRDKVQREKVGAALALVVQNIDSGETSAKDGKLQIAGIANLDPDKDINRQSTPEKIVKNAFRAERARIRAMSKGKGVIHKIVSRFISDNQFLMKKDPALKAIFDDQPKFNQFAKKIRKNIRRMFQRRGYDDAEIGKLLERMNVEAEIKNAATQVLLEYKR